MSDDEKNNEGNADMRAENAEQGMPVVDPIVEPPKPSGDGEDEGEKPARPRVFRRQTARERRIEMRRSGEMRAAQDAKRDISNEPEE